MVHVSTWHLKLIYFNHLKSKLSTKHLSEMYLMADTQFVSIPHFLQQKILTICDTPIYYLTLKFSQPLPKSSIFSSMQLLGFLFQSSSVFLSTLVKAVPQQGICIHALYNQNSVVLQ